MNRTEYMAARQLIRNNGQRAIPWLQPEHAVIMLALGNQINDDIAAKEWFYNLTTKFSGTPNQWRI